MHSHSGHWYKRTQLSGLGVRAWVIVKRINSFIHSFKCGWTDGVAQISLMT